MRCQTVLTAMEAVVVHLNDIRALVTEEIVTAFLVLFPGDAHPLIAADVRLAREDIGMIERMALDIRSKHPVVSCLADWAAKSGDVTGGHPVASGGNLAGC